MFFGGRQASSTAQSICWERCSAATNWFQSCPKDIPAHFSLLLQLEFIYTLILVLSPSNRSPTTSETNQILLFEYSINFISQIYNEITTPTTFSPLLAYMDIERTYTVACKLLNLLRQNHNEVLQDAPSDQQQRLPKSLPSSGGPPLSLQPILNNRHDCSKRALTCLYEANSIFEYALRRWNMTTLPNDFRRNSFDIKTMLSARLDQQQQQQSRQIPQHGYHPGLVRQSLSPEYQHGQGYGTSRPVSQVHMQHVLHPDERSTEEYFPQRSTSS